MHKIEFFPGLVERMVQRRGRTQVFDRFEASRTALLVVDMQTFFCAPDTPGGRHARDIVPVINRLAHGLRTAGGTVVWIVSTFTDESARTWSTFFDEFCSPELRASILEGLADGASGHALWPDLQTRPEDLTVVKDRFSPFIAGASNLHEVLQARGLDTVLVTGTVTNVCCEATARDAFMLNYRTVMVADGNAAPNDAHHNATLSNIFGFVDVQFADEIVGRLAKAAPAHAAE